MCYVVDKTVIRVMGGKGGRGQSLEVVRSPTQTVVWEDLTEKRLEQRPA